MSNVQKSEGTELATLGGGCFWCVEAVFDEVQGVINVQSGYAGGTVKNPSYREVCAGTTGHAEVVQIEFDPNVISYQSILEIFWQVHDPTTLNRQGNDVGTQYRSAIFYHDASQKEIAEKSLAAAQEAGLWDDPIVTEVASLGDSFYPAEQEHKDYYANNPSQSYCVYVIEPKMKKFRKLFEDKLKANAN